MTEELDHYLSTAGILNVLDEDRVCRVLYMLIKDPTKAHQKLMGFLNLEYLKHQLEKQNVQGQRDRHLGTEVLSGESGASTTHVGEPAHLLQPRANLPKRQPMVPRGVSNSPRPRFSNKVLP